MIFTNRIGNLGNASSAPTVPVLPAATDFPRAKTTPDHTFSAPDPIPPDDSSPLSSKSAATN